MISSAPKSADPRLPEPGRRILAAAAAALALFVAQPGAAAESALATCDAETVDAAVLTLCLEGLGAEVALELEQVHERAVAYFEGLDAITGNDRASRALDQAQTAFALFRDLDCHLAQIEAGIGSTAADRALACRIDHDRAQIASLTGLIGDTEPAAPDAPATPDVAAADATDPILLGTTWRVVEIEGEPTDTGIETTLDIDDEGAVAGIGGCNRYFGTAEIGDEGGMAMGGIGATRMACDEATMAQETRYFAALERVAGFTLGEDGLELADPDGTVLVRLEPRTD